MPCPYCSMPMTNRRRVQCGAAACVRKYNAERTIKAARESRAKNGFWRSQIERICITCGNAWMADSSGTTQCCSRECTNVMRYGVGCGPRQPFTASQLRRRRLERLQIKTAVGSKGTTPWVAGRCIECGVPFIKQNSMTTYCTSQCKHRATGSRRRARQHGMKVTRVRRQRIYERDNWTCYLCGYPVDRTATVPTLDAPVLDHVIALARGGEHAEHNLKTAHFYCNSVKRDLLLSDVA